MQSSPLAPLLADLVQVTLIPGDGIGGEITDSVKEIFEYVNAPIEWEQYDVSGMSSSGEALFRQAMESLKRNRVGLKGMSCTAHALGLLDNTDQPQASFLHPFLNQGTFPGTLQCVNSLIFMHQSFSASLSRDSLPVIQM